MRVCDLLCFFPFPLLTHLRIETEYRSNKTCQEPIERRSSDVDFISAPTNIRRMWRYGFIDAQTQNPQAGTTRFDFAIFRFATFVLTSENRSTFLDTDTQNKVVDNLACSSNFFRECDNYNLKSHKRYNNNISRMKLYGYVGRVTIYLNVQY